MSLYNTYMNKDGTFNPDYYGYFQILGEPRKTPPKPADLENIAPNTDTRLSAVFAHAAGKFVSINKIFNQITEVEPSLWTPYDMHGAEYEGDSFQESVATALTLNKMAASQVNVHVNFDILPTSEAKQISIRDKWIEKGVQLPAGRDTTVYVVAPEEKLQAAIGMVQDFCMRSKEPDTHRGLFINESVARHALTEEQERQVSPYNGIAWFEVKQGVFFTLDRAMFERVKKVFGAEPTETDKKLPIFDAARPLTDEEQGIIKIVVSPTLTHGVPARPKLFPSPPKKAGPSPT